MNFCLRPGWWTVDEAVNAIEAGLAGRMMLEISPEQSFGVLSPSFKGNEGNYALQLFSKYGCTFLSNQLCTIHGTGLMPLECRFCHHSRMGLGKKCHHEIEKDWNTEKGKKLIVRWGNMTGFWQRQGLSVTEK
jgi:anaerobic selenocysteine-containing dehydrogenase